MKDARRVSLKSVAEEAGVSVSLVSKVLNNRLGTTGVSEELALRIRTAAERLGYRKNASALAFRSGRHDVIGVCLHEHGEVGSGIMEALLRGISSAARTYHQRLALNFFTSAKEFFEISGTLHRNVMDGLLVGGLPHPELRETIHRINREGLPVVTFMDTPLSAAIPNVGIDQQQVGYIATRHLIECGCRRIGHIRYHPDRFAGYRRAMKEAGIPIKSDWVLESKSLRYSYAAGEKAANQILRKKLSLDGVVAESDHQAIALINVLTRAGMRVPEDIRITGVDDAPFAQFTAPPLTSVSQEDEKKGCLAVELLLKARDRRDVRSIAIQPVLKIRGSTSG